jgi:hypothetical protein
MSVIREMVSRVETEQKAKLQQLKQMQEETKYFYNLLLSVYNHGVDYNHGNFAKFSIRQLRFAQC